MATVVIRLHDRESEKLDPAEGPRLHTSPEMSLEDAQLQHAHIQAHLVPHHEKHTAEDGTETITRHKGDAQGEPGTPLDLGWVTILNTAIDDSEVVGV